MRGRSLGCSGKTLHMRDSPYLRVKKKDYCRQRISYVRKFLSFIFILHDLFCLSFFGFWGSGQRGQLVFFFYAFY
jgi:hypothetical protein